MTSHVGQLLADDERGIWLHCRCGWEIELPENPLVSDATARQDAHRVSIECPDCYHPWDEHGHSDGYTSCQHPVEDHPAPTPCGCDTDESMAKMRQDGADY